jgi:prepilin-type N-terminal cleavage/methylation domain-containing protein
MKTLRVHGFTLIELLVVIAIIGVLVGLLLPAIQACREAARRSSCSNNLVQLMIALQNYEAAHEVLPPGVIEAQGPIRNEPVCMHHGWLIQLLPYLEEDNVYRQIDFKSSVYGAENATVRQTSFPLLICPSAVGNVRQSTSYAACHNDLEAPIDEDNHGVMFLNSHVRLVDITDGTSHTIFVGERTPEKGDLGWISGTRATLRNTGTVLNRTDGTVPTGVSVLADGVWTKPARPGALDPLDAAILAAAPIQPITYVGGFGSQHSGGVVAFGFGDGAIKHLTDDVSPRLLRQLGHRADGEIAVWPPY